MNEESGVDGEWAGDDLIVRVAWSYYKDEMTQDEIARRLSLSRASVGRLLDRARRLGIVTVQVDAARLAATELSSRLRRAFGLVDALVVPGAGAAPSGPGTDKRVGLGGAQLLGSSLASGMDLGVGYGSTVTETLRSTAFSSAGGVRLIALSGGVAGYVDPFVTSSPELRKADFRSPRILPAPLFTSSPEVADALREEPVVSSMLADARAVRLAVVGITAASTGTATTALAEAGLRAPGGLAGQQVVGDVLGHFFGADGEPVELEVHRSRIGIERADLLRIPTVIGVAGGLDKADAILGALRGSLLDVLVTDEPAAERLLAVARPAPAHGPTLASRTR